MLCFLLVSTPSCAHVDSPLSQGGGVRGGEGVGFQGRAGWAGGFNTCLTADSLFPLLISSFYNFLLQRFPRFKRFRPYLFSSFGSSSSSCTLLLVHLSSSCLDGLLFFFLQLHSSFRVSFTLLPCSMLTCRALPCSGGLCRVCRGVSIVSPSLSDTGDHSPFHGHDTICRRCFCPSVFL